jgi:hypothetical protein
MECPQCGKDLQPMPFTMIRPDYVLQSIVDKLFPDVIDADYVAEEEYYNRRRLPLPDHLVERKRRKAKAEAKEALARGLPVPQNLLDVSISMSELDASMAPSEADSELTSEATSVDAFLQLQEANLAPSMSSDPDPIQQADADHSSMDVNPSTLTEPNHPSITASMEVNPPTSIPPSISSSMDVIPSTTTEDTTASITEANIEVPTENPLSAAEITSSESVAPLHAAESSNAMQL